MNEKDRRDNISLPKTPRGIEELRGGPINHDHKGKGRNQLRNNLSHSGIESKIFKNNVQEPLIHPIIDLRKIKFEKKALLFSNFKGMNHFMNLNDGVQDLSTRDKTRLLRCNNLWE